MSLFCFGLAAAGNQFGLVITLDHYPFIPTVSIPHHCVRCGTPFPAPASVCSPQNCWQIPVALLSLLAKFSAIVILSSLRTAPTTKLLTLKSVSHVGPKYFE
ncbi:MAG: hypothetical protein JWN98_2150 [Abditibacteriota bacterium]|nr:hypothetical protein [Abditibacteriota bacterium]